MRFASFAAMLVLIFASACGKVGDPKPPIRREPQPVGDLSASQNGESVTLSWTNPARYVDNNDVSDLSRVHILRDGIPIRNEIANPPGQRQSVDVPINIGIETDLMFSVQTETQRGKLSKPSNVAPIRLLDVPGPPRPLPPLVDQKRIFLTWQPPERNPNLVQAYLVQRSDWPASVRVTELRYEDADYEPLMKYEYKVTALRGPGQGIPGTSPALIIVTAKDETPPMTPTGLEITGGPGDAFLKWNANTERDFKEVWVYRSDQEEPVFRRSTDGVTDPGYRSGLSYHLIALDESGNKSMPSTPVLGP